MYENDVSQLRLRTKPEGLLRHLEIFNDESMYDLTSCLKVECEHESVLLAGRYNKLSREVS